MKEQFLNVFKDVTKYGTKIPKENYLMKGKYPIFDQGQEYIAGYTNEENGIYSDVPIILFGDHTRIIKYIDVPCFLGADGVKLLKAKKENANYKYLYYALCHAHIPNTGYNRHFKWLKEINIIFPSNEEQQKIAAVLDKVSDLIALRKKQLEKLEELVKARFVEMFGDLRLNKKNWETGVLSNYYSIKGGKRIPKGMGYSKNITSHPYLRTTDMKNATILDDDIRYIDDNVFEHIKNYTVKKGDIYLTNVGVNLGMAGIIPDKYDGANLTENAVKFVPKKQKVHNALFLVYYINSYEIQNYINERKMSVGVPKLAIFRIETIPIKLPPLKLQEQFADFVTKVDKQKLTIQQSLAKLEVLKKALMQQYFG